jgi:hypothetical protein
MDWTLSSCLYEAEPSAQQGDGSFGDGSSQQPLILTHPARSTRHKDVVGHQQITSNPAITILSLRIGMNLEACAETSQRRVAFLRIATALVVSLFGQ